MSGTEHISRDAVDHVIKVGGEDLLVHLIDLFEQTVPQRIFLAKKATKKGDLPAVEQALHALRSGASNLGALALTELATTGEEQAREGVAEGLKEIISKISAKYDIAAAELEEIRKEL